MPVFTDKGFLLVDYPLNEAINHLFPTYKLIFPTFLKLSDLSEKIEEAAGGAGSKLGTGGMLTKVHASRLAAEAGINAVIANGNDPEIIYDILNGEDVGTLFIASEYDKKEN